MLTLDKVASGLYKPETGLTAEVSEWKKTALRGWPSDSEQVVVFADIP